MTKLPRRTLVVANETVASDVLGGRARRHPLPGGLSGTPLCEQGFQRARYRTIRNASLNRSVPRIDIGDDAKRSETPSHDVRGRPAPRRWHHVEDRALTDPRSPLRRVGDVIELREAAWKVAEVILDEDGRAVLICDSLERQDGG